MAPVLTARPVGWCEGASTPMFVLLDRSDRISLRKIFESAFTRGTLTVALAGATERDYEQLVKSSDFSNEIFQLIGIAEKEGWLDELIALVPQNTERQDLRQGAEQILQRAQQRELRHGGGETSALVALRRRFWVMALAFVALGVLSAGLGVAAWLLDPQLGFWALPVALVALVAAVAGPWLLGRSGLESSDFVLSRMPLGLLTAMALAVGATGYAFLTGMQSLADPNFILRLAEEEAPLAEQPVTLMTAAEDWHDSKVTNTSGEAFFALAFGSSKIYRGEFSRQGKRCQIPAFPIRDLTEHSLSHDMKDLRCQAGGANDIGDDADALRPDDTPRTPAVDLSDLDLPIDLDKRLQRAPLGVPGAPLVFDRRFYSVGFDPDLRAPRWVSFIVDETNTIEVPRTGSPFRPDPALPPEIQTDSGDFLRNPYDRGTLVRRSDAGYGAATLEEAQLAEREAFYYSIVVPQPDKTNQVTWLGVEQLTGRISRDFGKLHVIAGPVYQKIGEANDAYLVVGPGRTLVPLYVYRVLLRQARTGQWRAVAFLVPNDGSVEKDASRFATSVAEVEKATGLNFFPDLPPGSDIKGNTSLSKFQNDETHSELEAPDPRRVSPPHGELRRALPISSQSLNIAGSAPPAGPVP